MTTNPSIFLEVFQDVRFPFFAADVGKLRVALATSTEDTNSFVFDVTAPPERRSALVQGIRGLLRRIDVPPQIAQFLFDTASCGDISGPEEREKLARPGAAFSISEVGDLLVWAEASPWPVAYSTFLEQLAATITLHRTLIEQRIRETTKFVNSLGWSASNIDTVSEAPRQLPTHVHYAAASLGAWVGGAMNVQYFAYYAAIRQIFHSSLNVSYAKRMGFSDDEAASLDSGGLVAVPAAVAMPLLEAQGNAVVFGSISIDEFNTSNQPAPALYETQALGHAGMPGLIVDKYYRAPFRARKPGDYGLYGTQDVLRDQYEEFYRGLEPRSLLRCKHYCVPLVEVSSVEAIRQHVSKIPQRHKDGVFFRGQRKLHLIRRDRAIQQLLFASSCGSEPSLLNSASRESGYDYDDVHFRLKHFLEADLLQRCASKDDELFARWQRKSVSPTCELDLAVLALAQHYGLPTHGLDVTRSVDVALWFATNIYTRDEQGGATYTRLATHSWPTQPEDWPVVIACQSVTHSIEQSLHECRELAEFGFPARRPHSQSALFFQGGHSDHQNRLAEAVVCVFRLMPGEYPTKVTFESLFPPPSEDPAYRVMLRFASAPGLGKPWGRFVNRFHAQA